MLKTPNIGCKIKSVALIYDKPCMVYLNKQTEKEISCWNEHPTVSILIASAHLFVGTDDEQQEYDYLGAWGPRFDKLANMYGPEAPNPHNTELEL